MMTDQQQLETELVKYQSSTLEIERARSLSRIYGIVVRLSGQIVRGRYRGLPEHAYGDIAHDTASSIIMTVTKRTTLTVDYWYSFINSVCQFKIIDWFERSYSEIPMVELDALNPQQVEDEINNFQYQSKMSIPLLTAMIPDFIRVVARRCVALQTMVKLTSAIKKNYIFNLALASLVADKEATIRQLDHSSQARVRLLRHMLAREIQYVQRELYSA